MPKAWKRVPHVYLGFATLESSATESIPAINARNIKYWEPGGCDVSDEVMNWMSLPTETVHVV